ncbi:MAG: DUF1295 domain-containing protein, partial [Pseudomonadota bacterium]
LVAFNRSLTLSLIEILGFAIAIIALALESLADYQKGTFVRACKARGERLAVCQRGLWRYSRHPNYFFEWMVWNGLILMALPALPEAFETEHTIIALFLTAGLLFVSRLMYQTLVHLTGARPAEYYSLKKRPAYADYQKTTNRFFPWIPKGVEKNGTNP